MSLIKLPPPGDYPLEGMIPRTTCAEARMALDDLSGNLFLLLFHCSQEQHDDAACQVTEKNIPLMEELVKIRDEMMAPE